MKQRIEAKRKEGKEIGKTEVRALGGMTN